MADCKTPVSESLQEGSKGDSETTEMEILIRKTRGMSKVEANAAPKEGGHSP